MSKYDSVPRDSDPSRPEPSLRHSLVQRLSAVVYESTPSRANKDLWALVFVNDALTRLTGYPVEDFLGETPKRYLFDLVHPHDRARVGSEYDRCRITLSPVTVRYRLRHVSGDYRWVDERATYSRDGDGRLRSTACLFEADGVHTEGEWQAELDGRLARLAADLGVTTGQEFLELLCRRLAYLANVRQVGIFRVDRQRYLECLAVVRDGLLLPRYGIRMEDSIFRPLADRRSLAFSLAAEEQTWSMLEDIGHVLAIRLNNRQHEWLGVLALGHDHPIEQDETLNRILALYADRTVVEIERLGLERQLQDSERRYRAFFDSAVLPSVVVTLEGRVLDFNRAARRLFRMGDDGRAPTLELADILPRQQPDGRHSLYHFLRFIRSAVGRTAAEARWVIHRLDGQVRTVNVHAVSSTLNLSERVLLAFDDLTDRLRAEEELSTQHRLMEERQDRLRGLVDLATELERQPSVDGFLDAASRQLLDQNGIRRAVYFDVAEQRWCEVGADAQPDAAPDQAHRAALVQVCDSGEPLWRERERHWLYLPLLDEDRVEAVLIVEYQSSDFDDREFMSALIKTIRLSFDNLQQRLTLKRQAMRDSLTGLGNRAQLHDWVRDALDAEPDQTASLLLFDLNRFKEINDSLGHHFGDRLLCEIGPRVMDVLGRVDGWGVTRLGGDEFAVFLPRVTPDQAIERAEAVADSLRLPYCVDELQFQVEASIGIAHYPTQGRDGHELLRCADVAMYAAKGTGRSLVEFDPSLDANTPQRIAVLSELEQGLRDGQLWVAYQPVVSAENGDTKGFEALVRWQHPELGALSPAEFIPIAEMGQGIHRITEFVLGQGLAALADWRGTHPDLYLAVNLSARVLLDQNLPGNIDRLLKRYDLPGTALVLELTESTLLSDPLRAVDIINELAALDIQVEVDDFGTGYSSLAYLKSLPIQALKVDKSFVADLRVDPQDRVIVESTIKMAHNLGLQTIAEGVEDEATLVELVKMGCDAIQGYYFSKPLPATEIVAWLRRNG